MDIRPNLHADEVATGLIAFGGGGAILGSTIFGVPGLVAGLILGIVLTLFKRAK